MSAGSRQRGELAALYVLGWLNFGDSDTGAFVPDSFFVGLNVGLGVRGKINEALSIGTEWGWGFAKFTDNAAVPDFANGFFGTIVFEASIGV